MRTARRPALRLPPWASAGWRRRLGWRVEEWWQALSASLEAELEERRGFLWLPVLFGLGVLAYFALPVEPVLPALGAAAVLAGAFAIRAYHAGSAFRLLAVLTAILAGATAAKLRVERLDQPRIAAETTALVEGRVSRIEVRAGRRPRLTLDNLAIERLAPEATPASIHVTLPPSADLPAVGTHIAVLARLMPVPGPALPGGYDARRRRLLRRHRRHRLHARPLARDRAPRPRRAADRADAAQDGHRRAARRGAAGAGGRRRRGAAGR